MRAKNTHKRRRDLTPEEAATLRAYADAVGEKWKERLSIDWLRGGTGVRLPAGLYYGTLQGVRNSLGPSWLAGFEFAADEEGTTMTPE